MRVFLTGANGFIARATAARLREQGHQVYGVDLHADAGAGVVAGDITVDGPWQDAISGADVVIHTAAVVSNAVGLAGQWRVNVAGTRRALDAAVRGGSRAVRAAVVDPGVLRPGVPGRCDRGSSGTPGRQPVRGHEDRRRAGGAAGVSPVYVDDLVGGLILAATSPAGAGQVFTLAGGVGVPCREFFGHYYRMLGRRGPVVAPTAVAVGVARVAGRLIRLTGAQTEVNAVSMRYFTRTGTYSIAKARRLLGYQPAVDLGEGMARTGAWLRAEGLVP